MTIRAVDGVLSLVLRNIPLYTSDIDSVEGITGVGLGMHGYDDDDTAIFDWVYVAAGDSDRRK